MLGKHGNDTEQTFAFCGSISDRCRGLFLRGYKGEGFIRSDKGISEYSGKWGISIDEEQDME